MAGPERREIRQVTIRASLLDVPCLYIAPRWTFGGNDESGRAFERHHGVVFHRHGPRQRLRIGLYLGPPLQRQAAQPVAQALRLAPPQPGLRNLDATRGDVNAMRALGFGCVARRIADALAMAHQPNCLRQRGRHGAGFLAHTPGPWCGCPMNA